MNFTDRTTLGITLARRLEKLRGKDAVILCLQESSLMTCLTLATQLRAWVYPLIFAPVYAPGHLRKLLGAFDQDGEFCPLRTSATDEEELSPEMNDFIHDHQASSMKAIHTKEASYEMSLDKHILDERHVILAADVLTSPLPVLVAQQFLKNVGPKSRAAVVGNATPEAARFLRMSASDTEIMDILIGVISDDNHYFEHIDKYTDKEMHTLTQHIAAYWQ